MSRSWADQIEAEDQDQDEDQVHEDQDPGAVEGEVRPTAEVPTTRSSTRMPARAASRTRERTADKGSGPLRVFRVETHLSLMVARLVTS